MGAVRSWLLAIIATSLLCALADALMPKGGVKRAGRLICGLVLLAVILSPEVRRAELEEEVGGQMKIIIEGEYAAYIVDKAAELGAACTARVECLGSEDGLYLPARAEVSGTMTEAVRGRLVRIIREDLGVPENRIYICEEEVP